MKMLIKLLVTATDQGHNALIALLQNFLATLLSTHLQVKSDANQFSAIYNCQYGGEIVPKELPRIFDKFYRIPNNALWK